LTSSGFDIGDGSSSDLQYVFGTGDGCGCGWNIPNGSNLGYLAYWTNDYKATPSYIVGDQNGNSNVAYNDTANIGDALVGILGNGSTVGPVIYMKVIAIKDGKVFVDMRLWNHSD
jgi:hypothetical protein